MYRLVAIPSIKSRSISLERSSALVRWSKRLKRLKMLPNENV